MRYRSEPGQRARRIVQKAPAVGFSLGTGTRSMLLRAGNEEESGHAGNHSRRGDGGGPASGGLRDAAARPTGSRPSRGAAPRTSRAASPSATPGLAGYRVDAGRLDL